jgi:hypothetical protein
MCCDLQYAQKIVSNRQQIAFVNHKKGASDIALLQFKKKRPTQ